MGERWKDLGSLSFAIDNNERLLVRGEHCVAIQMECMWGERQMDWFSLFSLRLIIIGVSVSPVSGSPVPVFLAPKTPCPTFCHWSQPPQAHWVTTKTIIKHVFFASYFFLVNTVLYSFFCSLVLASSCFLLIQCFFSFLFFALMFLFLSWVSPSLVLESFCFLLTFTRFLFFSFSLCQCSCFLFLGVRLFMSLYNFFCFFMLTLPSLCSFWR